MRSHLQVTAWSGFLALVALTTVAGCRRSQPSDAAEHSEWERGDRAVVEERAGEFYEARVVGVEGDQLHLQRVRGGPSTTLSSHEVYRLPSLAVPVPEQFLVCSPEAAQWVPCRTTRVTDTTVTAVDPRGTEFSVPRERVVVPGRLTTLNIERRFADSKRDAQFLTEASRSGPPRVDPDWSPGPHEHVIVQRDEGWFSARVHELEKDRVHVRWDSDHRVTEVPRGRVVPEGPYATDPVLGGFVLARPHSPAEPWELLRVRLLVEEHSVVVENARGERRTLPLRDVVPLVTRAQ